SHLGAVEFSGSFYQGFNHLPSFQVAGAQRNGVPLLEVDQFYPKLRMYGGDAAVPFRWLTLKNEAAYFSTPDPRVDQYAQYVIQLERQSGEWSFVGGYAGEAITDYGTSADFAPDRGITKTFLGSAHYTIDTNRSIAVETSIRQNMN